MRLSKSLPSLGLAVPYSLAAEDATLLLDELFEPVTQAARFIFIQDPIVHFLALYSHHRRFKCILH